MKKSLISSHNTSLVNLGFVTASALTALLAFMLFSGCPTTKSTVTIPANQQFILGDVEKKAFRADLQNLSDETVFIFSKNQAGDTTQSFGLAPKGNAKVYMAKHETAILKNTTGGAIKVKAKLNKSVEGMRYEHNN